MGAEIDRLEVAIETKATKVNNSLDNLVTKLEKISTSLAHVNSAGLVGLSNGVSKFAQASAQLSNVKTADFTRLAKNIQSIANLNAQQIYSAASAMTTIAKAMNNLGSVSANSMQVAQVAKDISKLGNKNVQIAITNLPQLANELKNLMQTLSTASQVSQNVIQMTTALANLASQGSKVSSAANALQSNMSRTSGSLSTVHGMLKKVSDRITIFGNSIQKADKKTKSFSSTIGSLYQRYFLLARGMKGLWGSIEESMNYLETLNYFNAAYGQVADAAVSQWKKAGYDSAESYYESFSNRAKELTAKMTGFNITDKGNLEATGLPSLGINPSSLMNYQAMFAQMSSSMGVASETALKLSDALTMIGADLASVKNMDFEAVWHDMASGLAGMSRTLDKYGVNIRNVNLQQKLHELGINANITSLNQNDKALLRTIILLDSTRYAWGDLANTINAPANQIRLLKANLENLARTMGNLFLPIIQKVLPYLNAFVIVLQRILGYLASLLKIDLSKITSSIGNNDGMSDFLDNIDDAESGLEDTDKAAKKLRNTIFGFDQLNVLNGEDEDADDMLNGGISGLLDDAFLKALSEYQKAWDEAFANMENSANKLADKIETFLKDLFKPIKDAWKNEGQFVMNAWSDALKNVKGLIGDIGNDLMTVWQQEGTIQIFQDIFHIIGDIGLMVSHLAENFNKAWNENNSGLKILENIRDIFAIIVDYIRKAADFTVEWAANLNFSPILEAFERLTAELSESGGLIESVSGILYDFYTMVLLPLGKWILEEGLPDLLDVLTAIVDKVEWEKLKSNLADLWTHLEPFAEKVGEGLILFVEDVGFALADFVNSEEFSGFLDKLGKWMDSVSAEDVASGLKTIATAIIGLKGALLGFKGIKVVTSIGKALKDFALVLGTIKTKISSFVGLLKGIDFVALFSTMNPGMIGELGLTIDRLLEGTFLDTATWTGIPKKIHEGIMDLIDTVMQGLGNALLYTFESTFNWDATLSLFESAKENFKKGGLYIIQGIFEGILAAIGLIVEPVGDFFVGLWNAICGVFGIHSPAESMKPLGEYILLGIIEGFLSKVSEFATAVQTWFDESVAPWFSAETWMALWENIKTAASMKWSEFVEWWQGTAIYGWWTENVMPWFEIDSWTELFGVIQNALSGVWDSLVEWWESSTLGKWWDNNVAPYFEEGNWTGLFDVIRTTLKGVWDDTVGQWASDIDNWWKNDVEKWFNLETWSSLLAGIVPAFKDRFKEARDSAVGWIEDMYNSVVGWVKKAISAIQGVIDKIKEATTAKSSNSSSGSSTSGKSSGGYTIKIPTIKIPTIKIPEIKIPIPAYATGGFPEDGFFMANHGELVGQFSNGKTAVANNEQIIEGIKAGVYEAVVSALQTGNFGRGETIVNAVLKTENDEVLARAVARGNDKMTRRYQPKAT